MLKFTLSQQNRTEKPLSLQAETERFLSIIYAVYCTVLTARIRASTLSAATVRSLLPSLSSASSFSTFAFTVTGAEKISLIRLYAEHAVETMPEALPDSSISTAKDAVEFLVSHAAPPAFLLTFRGLSGIDTSKQEGRKR